MTEPVVIALITVLGGIVGNLSSAWIQRGPGPNPTRGRTRWLVLGAVAGLVLGLAGFGIVRWIGGGEPALSIDAPQSGATVPWQQIEVRGTWSNVSDRDAPRLIVYVDDLRLFYPDAEMLDLTADGKWSARVLLGNENDSGKTFDIIAITSNAEAQEVIDEYLDQGRETGVWPGMPALPDGATRRASVTVVRQ